MAAPWGNRAPIQRSEEMITTDRMILLVIVFDPIIIVITIYNLKLVIYVLE